MKKNHLNQLGAGPKKSFSISITGCGKRAVKTIPIVILIVFFILTMLLLMQGCSNKIPVALYFAVYEDNNAYLEAETKNIAKDANLYKNAIEELIKGPEDGQLNATLPPDVKVNSVTVSDGLAIVDFSREIITSTGTIPHSSTTEVLAIFSIVDTLTEFEEIQKVRITVEGKQKGEIDGLYIEDFWGHTGIYEDFERNEQIIGTNK